jgi:hypothetical protein
MGPEVRAHQECRFSTTVSAQVNSTFVFGAAFANISEFAKNVQTTGRFAFETFRFWKLTALGEGVPAGKLV